MPDSLEFPGMRRAVVPLVRTGEACIHDVVADWPPRLSAVAGSLDELPEPSTVLRRIEAIQVSCRSLHMVDPPAGKVGASDVPPFALCIRSQYECTLARPDQRSHTAHLSLSRTRASAAPGN